MAQAEDSRSWKKGETAEVSGRSGSDAGVRENMPQTVTSMWSAVVIVKLFIGSRECVLVSFMAFVFGKSINGI